MSKVRIHQFAPATANGDGISTGMLFTRKLLLSLGFESEIFSGTHPRGISTRSLDAFDPSRCDLLMIHHSMGHELEDWILAQRCPRVMIYHNITPCHFFSEDSPEYHYAQVGREQLKRWSHGVFIGAIGDSPYNTEELIAQGYSDAVTLPLLVDLERFGGAASPTHSVGHDTDRPMLLSVGRIAENKRQHLMVEALWHLKQMPPTGPLPQLLLAGSTTSEHYRYSLQRYIQQLGLQDDVILVGKCSDAELRGLYQGADAYWCASAHEGFCMPLIEAGWFDLPVISFASSNIPATLGEAGLILEQSDPEALAAVTAELLANPALKAQLIQAGHNNLQRFSAETLKPQLLQYINGLNLPHPV